MSTHHLIIGNGIAGVSAAEEIRRRSPRAMITLISDEPGPLYSRPGLAYVLSGEISASTVYSRAPKDYEAQHIDLVHARVCELDLPRRHVLLDDGTRLSYDRLLLATGAAAVPAPFPGRELDGVAYLDTFQNVQDLLTRLSGRVHSAVVVGGGITAMELAEGLARREVQVHYLLRKKSMWSALLTDSESRIIESHALEHGVQLHFDQEIAEICGVSGRVSGVRTSRGDSISCQLVGAAIGVRPKLGLVAGTEIRKERGIVVDEFLESSVPGIFAAGDAAQVLDPFTGQSRSDLLWHSAQAMGRIAGANMTGARKPYLPPVPFNAARLFGIHLTSIGRAGAEELRKEGTLAHSQPASRGTSEGWWARTNGPTVTTWSRSQKDSLRLVLDQNRIAGALLLGNQDLASPLRRMIMLRADVSSIRNQLDTGGSKLGSIVGAFYEQWRHSGQGAAQ